MARLGRLVGSSLLATSAMLLPFAPAVYASSTPGPNTLVPVQTGVTTADVPGASVFGNTPANTPETVSFVLREQNMPTLEAAVEQGVSTRNYLSVSQFAQEFGQSQYNISALESYLGQFGITTVAYPDNLDVVANGTAGGFDNALEVQQKQYYAAQQPGRGGTRGVPAQWFHGTAQSPELPYHLAQFVTAILGLTNYGPFTSQAVHIDTHVIVPQSASSNACVALTGLPNACNTPANFASNYGLAPLYHQGAAGTGQTLAIVTLAALDQGAPEYFWTNILGLPTSSRTVTVTNVDGGPGAPSDVAGTGETDLDVEQSGALAPGANVIVYQAPNTDSGFADAFFMAASQNSASTVSSSWGESETYLAAFIASGQESPAYETAFDEAFLEMAVQGQSGFIASGDEGAYMATADLGTTNLAADASADSPFITAAGGTTLPWSGTLEGPTGTTANVTVPAQRTWGWDYLWAPVANINGIPLVTSAELQVVGSGGGYSTIEPAPSYQRGVPGTSLWSAVQYLTPTTYQSVDGIVEPTAWNFNPTPSVTHGYSAGRAIPDVSADADPYSGYLLYNPSATQDSPPQQALQGGWGGTSFVAPQLNGATAVIDSALGHRVGFWNPVMYAAATSSRSPVTPIDTMGTGSDNIYYTGTPGTLYNAGSGLGYPNLSALAADFAGAQRGF